MTPSINETARVHIREGKYEDALRTLDDGLVIEPKSASIRAARLNALQTAVSQLTIAAQAHAYAGRVEMAREALNRVIAIDPANTRAREYLIQMQREAEASDALEKAVQLADSGARDPALATVEEALRYLPAHEGLVRLRDRLRFDQRASDALLEQKVATGKTVSLEFRDASVRSIFEAVSRTTGINFIIDKDVPADLRSTIFLREAELDDAIALITATANLSKKVINPSTVQLYPNTPDKQRVYQDLVVRAFYPANASARQLADMLKAMLKIRDPYVDERTNMVVIRESADVVRLAERLIALQDLPDAEVILEVEVLEVSATRLNELGIKYPSSVTLTPLSLTGGSQLTLSDLRGVDSSRTGISTPSLTVNLRREVGDVNTLANPRIRTKSREKARIVIGDKLPIVTTTATSTGFISENVQFIDVGLKLEVIPTVHPDGNVGIKIDLEVSSLTRQVRTPNGSVTYEIGTRNASTVLKLKDGETQLLAGLIKREDRTESARIPGLGDVPLVGRLFSSQLDDGKNSEVVLSIMPRIVRSASRPEINFAEFWSGTEAYARTRSLSLRDSQIVANINETRQLAGHENTLQQSAGGFTGAPVSVLLRAQKDVVAGETITVSVDVNSSLSLRGMPFTLAFDKTKFAFEDVEEGELLKGDGVDLSISKSVQRDMGSVMIGILRNKAEGVVASGTLARLRFKALNANGIGKFTVVSVTPMGVDGKPGTGSLPDALLVNVLGK